MYIYNEIVKKKIKLYYKWLSEYDWISIVNWKEIPENIYILKELILGYYKKDHWPKIRAYKFMNQDMRRYNLY